VNVVYQALKEIGRFLDELGQPYAVIGGIAAGCRGQPRTTNDVDLTMWVELGKEQEVIASVLKKFPALIDNPAEFAMVNRILVIQATNGVVIDLALASYPFEEAMLRRATRVKLAKGLTVPVLTAEDVVVTKSLAGRDIDWFDIQGVFDRLGPKLDYPAILERLREISELIDYSEVAARLDQVRKQSTDLDEPI
jgi:hypothetical protein